MISNKELTELMSNLTNQANDLQTFIDKKAGETKNGINELQDKEARKVLSDALDGALNGSLNISKFTESLNNLNKEENAG